MLSDLAVADGAEANSGIAVLTDRQDVFGAVASIPTVCRVLDRIDTNHLPRARAAPGEAQRWASAGWPEVGQRGTIDFDATITMARSQKETYSVALP